MYVIKACYEIHLNVENMQILTFDTTRMHNRDVIRFVCVHV